MRQAIIDITEYNILITIMDHHPHLPDIESEHEFIQANKQHFDGIACRYDQNKNTEILARK